MKRFLTFCFLGGLILQLSSLQAQVVINEVQYQGTDRIELKNLGAGMADISGWWICHLFSYSAFTSLTLESGSLNMPPGSITVLSGMALNDNNSDLGIYNSASFGSSTAMQDFVQWGTGGQGRESVAVTKGIWTAGDFVPTVSMMGSSIEYDGAGDASTDWFEQTSPTFGMENGILQTCDGGTVSSTSDTLFYCIGAGSGVFSFDSTTTSTDSYAYVVTDNNGIILGLPPGDMVDFTPAPPGECWVWGLSYTGNITAQVGDDATMVALSDGCFDLSDNFVVVFRDTTSGGMVTTSGGEDEATVCLGAGTTTLSFDSSMAVGPNFAYVVTDLAGTILGLPPGDMVNFGPAGPGTCLVWGLSYTGNLTAQLGDDATSVDLSDGCFDLSDNFVTVVREDTVEGGMVMTATGEDTIYYCVSGTGGGSGMIQFDSTGTAGSNYAYVVTDPSGVILALPPGDMADFTPAPPGECWIWGLAYTGTVTAQVGDDASMVDLSDGCFDLSDNFVVIFRDSVDGGMVSEVGGADTVNVCLADTTSGSGVVRFESSAAAGPNFAYVVTDTEGVILGLPPGNSVDFAPAGVGECWVWGLSYSGEVTAQVGDTATAVSLTTGCYDLSDEFVVVFRDSMGPGCVTSISNELSLENFQLAPNPAVDQVSVSFWQAEALNQETVVTLYNLAGQQLQVERFSLFGQGTQEFQLSVADLSQGMYLLQIQQGTRQMTTRLLKQ